MRGPARPRSSLPNKSMMESLIAFLERDSAGRLGCDRHQTAFKLSIAIGCPVLCIGSFHVHVRFHSWLRFVG